MVHISQIVDERVDNVNDYLRVGDIVKVKVLDLDNTGRIRLSIKAVNEENKAQDENAEAQAEASETSEQQ